MRFFSLPVAFVLVLFLSAPAFAQDSEDMETGLEEYESVPKGVLMPKIVAPAQTIEENNDAGVAMTPEEIQTAYADGKFDLVAKHIIPLAKNGYHPAEELLGVMYRNGQGVPKNLEQAVYWLNKASEANRPLAQHHLAVMSFTGDGLPEDVVKALMWLHIAIQHYPDGPEKKRAIEDRASVYSELSRRDKDRAKSLAREWLAKRDEKLLLDEEEK